MTDYIGPLGGNLEMFTKRVQQKYCSICGHKDWDAPLLVYTPIGHGDEAHFVADHPFTQNAMLITAVYACQECRYELRFRVGVVDPRQ